MQGKVCALDRVRLAFGRHVCHASARALERVRLHAFCAERVLSECADHYAGMCAVLSRCSKCARR